MGKNCCLGQNENSFKKKFNEIKPILSFFAAFSLYGFTIALLLGFFLAGGIILISII